MKSDFILRTITETSEVSFKREKFSDATPIQIIAHRSRSSSGMASIMLTVNGKSIEFDSSVFGDKYEAAAREAIEVLDRICNAACSLELTK